MHARTLARMYIQHGCTARKAAEELGSPNPYTLALASALLHKLAQSHGPVGLLFGSFFPTFRSAVFYDCPDTLTSAVEFRQKISWTNIVNLVEKELMTFEWCSKQQTWFGLYQHCTKLYQDLRYVHRRVLPIARKAYSAQIQLKR